MENKQRFLTLVTGDGARTFENFKERLEKARKILAQSNLEYQTDKQ